MKTKDIVYLCGDVVWEHGSCCFQSFSSCEHLLYIFGVKYTTQHTSVVKLFLVSDVLKHDNFNSNSSLESGLITHNVKVKC